MESARAAGERTSPIAARAASAGGASSGPECATASFSALRMRFALCPAPACRGSRGACRQQLTVSARQSALLRRWLHTVLARLPIKLSGQLWICS